jgi:hypothetical protein
LIGNIVEKKIATWGTVTTNNLSQWFNYI